MLAYQHRLSDSCVQAEQHTELVNVVSKLAKQEAAAEKEATAAAAKADDTAGQEAVPIPTNIAGNAAAALQQVSTWLQFLGCQAFAQHA